MDDEDFELFFETVPKRGGLQLRLLNGDVQIPEEGPDVLGFAENIVFF